MKEKDISIILIISIFKFMSVMSLPSAMPLTAWLHVLINSGTLYKSMPGQSLRNSFPSQYHLSHSLYLSQLLPSISDFLGAVLKLLFSNIFHLLYQRDQPFLKYQAVEAERGSHKKKLYDDCLYNFWGNQDWNLQNTVKNHVIHDKSWLQYFCGCDYITHGRKNDFSIKDLKKDHFVYELFC